MAAAFEKILITYTHDLLDSELKTEVFGGLNDTEVEKIESSTNV